MPFPIGKPTGSCSENANVSRSAGAVAFYDVTPFRDLPPYPERQRTALDSLGLYFSLLLS